MSGTVKPPRRMAVGEFLDLPEDPTGALGQPGRIWPERFVPGNDASLARNEEYVTTVFPAS